jgi:hypothetical protein
LLAASILVWRNRRIAAAVLMLELLPAYLILQIWWRDHARSLASTQLGSLHTAVFPASDPRCQWIILSAAAGEMAVHCVSSPAAKTARTEFRVALRSDQLIQASLQSPAVQELREKIPFSFAEVNPRSDGGADVLWRDLRIAYRERARANPTGLLVRLDKNGKIIGEHYRWWLSVW